MDIDVKVLCCRQGLDQLAPLVRWTVLPSPACPNPSWDAPPRPGAFSARPGLQQRQGVAANAETPPLNTTESDPAMAVEGRQGRGSRALARHCANTEDMGVRRCRCWSRATGPVGRLWGSSVVSAACSMCTFHANVEALEKIDAKVAAEEHHCCWTIKDKVDENITAAGPSRTRLMSCPK